MQMPLDNLTLLKRSNIIMITLWVVAAALRQSETYENLLLIFKFYDVSFKIGLWRSWVAHMSGGHGVASSSLASPNIFLHYI